MSEKYWNTFVVTGRAADYLKYKDSCLEKCGSDDGEKHQKSMNSHNNKQTGEMKRESDRSDGDGAVGGTHR